MHHFDHPIQTIAGRNVPFVAQWVDHSLALFIAHTEGINGVKPEGPITQVQVNFVKGCTHSGISGFRPQSCIIETTHRTVVTSGSVRFRAIHEVEIN